MKARNLKPGAFKNEILGTGPVQALPFFLALSLQVDSVGIVEDRPLRLWAEAFPYRHWGEADDLLAFLAETGMIVRYTSSEGQRLIYLPTFLKHQRPHKDEKPSLYLTPQEEAEKRRGSHEISRDSQGNTLWSSEVRQGFPPESGLPSPLNHDFTSSEGGLYSSLTHPSAEGDSSGVESTPPGQVQDVDFPAGPKPSPKMSVSEALAHPVVRAVVDAWKVICTQKDSVFLEPSPGLIVKKFPEIIASSEADPNWLNETLEVIAWVPTSDFNAGRVPPLKEGGDPFILTFAALMTTGISYKKHAEMQKDLARKALLAKATASRATKDSKAEDRLTTETLDRMATARAKKTMAKKSKSDQAQAELDRLADEEADLRAADDDMEAAQWAAEETLS